MLKSSQSGLGETPKQTYSKYPMNIIMQAINLSIDANKLGFSFTHCYRITLNALLNTLILLCILVSSTDMLLITERQREYKQNQLTWLHPTAKKLALAILFLFCFIQTIQLSCLSIVRTPNKPVK